MRSQASIEIDRPIEEVFRLTNDHMPEWSTIVVKDEVIEESPDGVGTTFLTVTEENGRRMEFQGIVTRYEPPLVNAVEMTGTMFDLEVANTFEDLGGRTRVTQTSYVNGKGIFGLILKMFGWAMKNSSCKAAENELENLKRFCERQVDAPAEGPNE